MMMKEETMGYGDWLGSETLIDSSTMPIREGSQVSVRFSAHNHEHPSDHTHMVDFSDPDVLRTLSHHSRDLIKVIQKLEALSIDSTLPSLPKFVVIGDQSAGKSSIIEATCNITLPRSEGTCTRCPFKITTTAHDAAWSCKVSLHQRYSYTPHHLAKTSGSTFDNWIDNDEVDIFDFETITNRQDLDLVLRRAQLAILNPDRSPSMFLNVALNNRLGLSKSNKKVGFSPNIISLEISAPDLPELSFYDLPGAINTLGDESEQYLVDFVEALLKSYICDEKAFILLACACNQDLENSTALRFVRQCEATDRCIGVLTKPDLIELTDNRMKTLQELLVGNKGYRFGDGCFITRQLSQRELTSASPISYKEAREIEAAFFGQEPWSTILAEHRERFGIPNLQNTISQKLTKHILGNLPEIAGRIQAKLAHVKNELSTYPEQDTMPHITVHTEINHIVTAIKEQLDADSHASKFREDYRKIFSWSMRKMAELKPKVVVATPGYQDPPLVIDYEEEDDSPSKKQQTANGVSRAVSTAQTLTPVKSARRRKAVVRSTMQRAEFHLDEVKAKFDSAPGLDIPGQASQFVVRGLILETVQNFPLVAESILQDVQTLFVESLASTISRVLAQYLNTELFHETTRITRALFDELIEKVSSFVYALVAGETHRPIVYNPQYKTNTTGYKQQLHSERAIHRVKEYYETEAAQSNRAVPKLPEQHKKAADNAWVTATLGVDDYHREIENLAIPLAYYDTVSAQLIDNLAKHFETGLVFTYQDLLLRKLMVELQTGNQEHCKQLLAEYPERERVKARLEAEKEKLEQAYAELKGLSISHG